MYSSGTHALRRGREGREKCLMYDDECESVIMLVTVSIVQYTKNVEIAGAF